MLGWPALLCTKRAGSTRLRGADAAKLKLGRELQLQHVRRARLCQQHLALRLGRPHLRANSPVLLQRGAASCQHCA